MATARASTSNTVASGTSLSISKPEGTVEGDLLVAQNVLASNADPNGPGFIQIYSGSSRTLRQKSFFKIAGANEPDSYLFSWSGATAAGGGLACYAGPWDPQYPMRVHTGGASGTGTLLKTPAMPLDTPTYDFLAVAFFAIAASATFQMVGDHVERYEATVGKIALAAADENYPAGTTYSYEKEAQASASGFWIAHQAAFKPA